MNEEQVEEKIEAFYEEKDGEFSWHEFEWELESNKSVVIPGLGKVGYVEQHGGEGEGDQYWLVFSVVMESDLDKGMVRYFKKPGWYASYDGGHYDGELFEVTPQERVVTFYE